ncbi:MAG: type I toxin-antitoxin system SymE family toxin [Candidatus Thiodiazotropha sp. (ex Lucinoma kastoroae)]|nr:type I toxin-antitoxin system SymE family toxin [Candidatus Thiodiazotropha sp. (ex Lucinoma kastoroae)]
MADRKLTPERRSPKDKTRQTRAIKVREIIYSRIIKDKHHAHFDQTIETTVPWITMKGQWLEQAGFAIHAPIKVRVMEGCLALTVENKPTS